MRFPRHSGNWLAPSQWPLRTATTVPTRWPAPTAWPKNSYWPSRMACAVPTACADQTASSSWSCVSCAASCRPHAGSKADRTPLSATFDLCTPCHDNTPQAGPQQVSARKKNRKPDSTLIHIGFKHPGHFRARQTMKSVQRAKCENTVHMHVLCERSMHGTHTQKCKRTELQVAQHEITDMDERCRCSTSRRESENVQLVAA